MRTAKFVESYFDAWNHNDPERVANHLASDGIYIDMPENIQRTHDELVVFLDRYFEDFPHHYELIGEVLKSRNSIAFQYRVCPAGDCEDNLRSGQYCGAEFITLDGDSAVCITDYYDFPTAARADKYAKSGLQRSKMRVYKKRLEHVMISEQAYLQAHLTLPGLAQIVGCSVNHLSQVINAGFGMSFFDYLNSHRIKHARMLLSELEGSDGAVLNVAFSAGFNSNSAFYSAFKKHVGMTPAQFRQENAAKSPE